MTNINEQKAVRKRPRGRMEEITAERLADAIDLMVDALPMASRSILREFACAIALMAVQALAVDDSIEAVERMVGGL